MKVQCQQNQFFKSHKSNKYKIFKNMPKSLTDSLHDSFSLNIKIHTPCSTENITQKLHLTRA